MNNDLYEAARQEVKQQDIDTTVRGAFNPHMIEAMEDIEFGPSRKLGKHGVYRIAPPIPDGDGIEWHTVTQLHPEIKDAMVICAAELDQLNKSAGSVRRLVSSEVKMILNVATVKVGVGV